MNRLIKCLAPLLVFVACGVDAPADPARAPGAVEEVSSTTAALDDDTGAAPLLRETCSASSLGICANAVQGTVCGTAPARWCLPAQELPDGTMFCRCQSRSTE